MRSRSTSDALALLTLTLAGLACSSAAHADLWAYVDAQGRTHFASERVDDRYELFMRGPDRFGVLPLPALPHGTPQAGVPSAVHAAETKGDGASTDSPSWAPGAVPDASAARLLRFFDSSAAVRRAEPLVRAAAQQHSIDFALLQALIAAESGFDPQAVSPKGAVGLMQVMPATAQRYGVQPLGRTPVAQRLADPQLNLNTGARYLRDLMNRFEGRLDLALAAYNAGEGAVERHGNMIPPFAETQNYVRTVMQIYRALRPEPPPRPATRAVPTSAATAAAAAPSHEPAARDATPPGGAVGRRNMIAPLSHAR
ncbi:MAG: hypothetical protein RL087_143 [Pseudomonadota bacterium]